MRAAAPAVLALLAVGLYGCASSSESHPGVRNGLGRPPAAARPEAYPLERAKVEIYVSHAPARVIDDGRAFRVGLVLVNGLGHPFTVPGACSGWLAAGLSSSAVEFEPAYSAVGCAGDTIPVGTTRLTRTVQTTYQSCSSDPGATTTVTFPACRGADHGEPPPLPAGRYRLALDTSSVPHAAVPARFDITLTGS